MRVLVVGATGILRPAAEKLVAAGHRVTGVARSLERLPSGASGVSVDAEDPVALSTALGGQRWDGAIVYSPATSDESLAVLTEAVTGVFVTVLTSSAAAPGRVDPLLDPAVLLLGWHRSLAGVRWHTESEVSDAALRVLETGRSDLLGAVRPWGDRP